MNTSCSDATNVMNMGVSLNTAHSTKERIIRNATLVKTLRVSPTWQARGKEGGKAPKKLNEYNLPSHNSFNQFDRVQQFYLSRSQKKVAGVKQHHVSQENKGVK